MADIDPSIIVLVVIGIGAYLLYTKFYKKPEEKYDIHLDTHRKRMREFALNPFGGFLVKGYKGKRLAKIFGLMQKTDPSNPNPIFLVGARTKLLGTYFLGILLGFWYHKATIRVPSEIVQHYAIHSDGTKEVILHKGIILPSDAQIHEIFPNDNAVVTDWGTVERVVGQIRSELWQTMARDMASGQGKTIQDYTKTYAPWAKVYQEEEEKRKTEEAKKKALRESL